VATLEAGAVHSAVISIDGSCFTFGQNAFPQTLGRQGDPLAPLRVPELANATSVACGGLFTLAASNGVLYEWGVRVNDGARSVASPEALELDERVESVSAGWRHSAAVTSTGRAYTWGGGGDGQLGLGNPFDYWHPTRMDEALADERVVTQVSAAHNHTLLLAHIPPS
jgi:alpha-tubulin suppressor-like RCC1 family protein